MRSFCTAGKALPVILSLCHFSGSKSNESFGAVVDIGSGSVLVSVVHSDPSKSFLRLFGLIENKRHFEILSQLNRVPRP